MKKYTFIIPIMVVVAVLAMWHLNKNYSEIPFNTRILISFGGSIVSGVITYFLLKNDIQRIDPKPTDDEQKKR